MITLSVVVSSLFLLHTAQSATNQPWKKWTFCKNPEPNKNNQCLLKAIQDVEPDLLNGNAYFGTPSLDPIHINEMSMFQAGQEAKAVAINITFKDCDIIGLSAWQLLEAKSDWEKGDLFGRIKFKDAVQFLSNYKVNGKVLILPITGQGKSNITFDNLEAKLTMKGKFEDRKNKKYFTIDNFEVGLEPKRIRIYLENLFNGNKGLGDNMNNFLNENWEVILEEVRVPISKALGAAFQQISNRVFAKVPYDQLVPK